MVHRHKARIIDIALQAGVSTATVDRVLNARPGVRQKTIDRVNEAINWLDKATVRPKVIPSITADFTIDTIIAGAAGFANEILSKELVRAGRTRGIALNSTYPKRMDPFALAEALKQCLKRGTSGIIVQGLDHPLVREAIEEAHSRDIPVISILTSLPGARTLGYVGLDNRAAGRTAGLLMGRLLNKIGEIAVFLGGSLYRSHEEREMGFRAVVREEFPELTLLPPCQGKDDPERNYQMAAGLLESHPELAGIISLGGGNRGIEKAVLESGRKDLITYVAFNLTPLTKQALLTGVIDAVVHQDMARAAEMAIGQLTNHLTSRPVLFSHIPVEIIMRENVR